MPVIKIPFLLRFHEQYEYIYYSLDRMRRIEDSKWTKHFWDFFGGDLILHRHPTFSVDMTEVVAVRV